MYSGKFGAGVDYNHAVNVSVNVSIRAISYEENSIIIVGWFRKV
jgi:hypothetical protein